MCMLIGVIQARLAFDCAWAVDRLPSSRSNDPSGLSMASSVGHLLVFGRIIVLFQALVSP